MKRLLCALLAAALLLTPAVAAAPSAGFYGDVNGDGTVDPADAFLALQQAVEKIDLSPDRLNAADVSGSGLLDGWHTVDAVDALLLLRYSVGKIDRFPVEIMRQPPADALRLSDLRPDGAYRGVTTLQFCFEPTLPRFAEVQGAYFDGACWYVAMQHNDNGAETTRLQVLDAYGNTLRTSETLDLDHANNITYQPQLDRLVVSHCQGEEPSDFYTYSFVDPHTLTVTETGQTDFPFFAMAFAAEKGLYASARYGGETLDVCDDEMHLLRTYSVERPGSLSQGMFADERYLYFIRSKTEKADTELLVYTWDGMPVYRIPVAVDCGVEVESINIVNGAVYLMCALGSRFGGGCYLLTFAAL